MQTISYKIKKVKPSRLSRSLGAKLANASLCAMSITNGQEGPCLLFQEVLPNATYELIAVYPSLKRLLDRKMPLSSSLEKQSLKRAGSAIYRWMGNNHYNVIIPDEFKEIAECVDSHASEVAHAILQSRGESPRTLKMPASF